MYKGSQTRTVTEIGGNRVHLMHHAQAGNSLTLSFKNIEDKRTSFSSSLLFGPTHETSETKAEIAS